MMGGSIIEKIIELIPQIAFLITSCGTIVITIKKFFIKEINEKIKDLELSSIRTDLVDFINDLENDIQKSEIQKKNAHDMYSRYSELGGNSYVHSHWEKLEREGKL